MSAVSRYDRDVILYAGPVNREGYLQISSVLEQLNPTKNKDKKVCLVLVTAGGLPGAGFRIARALNYYYGDIDIFIPDICKSTGTLICIGAHRLIVADRGELGPLDVQLLKADEMFERTSGLSIIEALGSLEDTMLNAFRKYLIDIKGGVGSISTKLAADISAQLASSLVQPIASKIDPMTLGEHQRAVRIALEYGERLNEKTKSLRPYALQKLVVNYPEHGFVIDRKEAETLFNNVCAPCKETSVIDTFFKEKIASLPDIYRNITIQDITSLINKEASAQKREPTNENTTASIEDDGVQNAGSEPDRPASKKADSRPARKSAGAESADQ